MDTILHVILACIGMRWKSLKCLCTLLGVLLTILMLLTMQIEHLGKNSDSLSPGQVQGELTPFVVKQEAPSAARMNQGAASVARMKGGAASVARTKQGAASVARMKEGAASVARMEQGAASVATMKPGAASVPRGISHPGLSNMKVFSHIEWKKRKDLMISDEVEQEVRRHLGSHRGARRPNGKKLLKHPRIRGKPADWQTFQSEITNWEIYNEATSQVEQVLQRLSTEDVTGCRTHERGTQLKFFMTFADKGMAMMKPMRYSRDTETWPNHFYFSDFERHHAEIASYHLDRILGFRRVPPCAGRRFSIIHDIQRFAEEALAKTFFISPAGSLCFYGECKYYCDSGHAFCGDPGMIEGSVCAYLPQQSDGLRTKVRNPWRRSYSKHSKAEWEKDNSFCAKVRKTPPYNVGRRLLDLIDLSVFDFLTGNMDRHHYEIFLSFDNDSSIIHVDQGRAFGKSSHDEMSILAPLYQCCQIRKSTFSKLQYLNSSHVNLSHLMRKSLSRDLLGPVLNERHLEALDRRVWILLSEIEKCKGKGAMGDVIIDDGV